MGLLAVELADVRRCGLGLLGRVVLRVQRGFDVLLAEVVHHLPRLLGAVRGLLVVGFELGFRDLLVEFVDVRLGGLGLLLGLGVVHVELSFLPSAVSWMCSSDALMLVELKPHRSARSLAACSPIPDASACLMMASRASARTPFSFRNFTVAEVGVLALLEDLLGGVLRAAGDVLQSLLGLGCPSPKSDPKGRRSG